jgi:hypothetical protein
LAYPRAKTAAKASDFIVWKATEGSMAREARVRTRRTEEDMADYEFVGSRGLGERRMTGPE